MIIKLVVGSGPTKQWTVNGFNSGCLSNALWLDKASFNFNKISKIIQKEFKNK